jgi:hypothetical protein
MADVLRRELHAASSSPEVVRDVAAHWARLLARPLLFLDDFPASFPVRGSPRPWTWWTHPGGGNALAFKQP